MELEKSGHPGRFISPLLANIYLHYVLDSWITKKVANEINGRIFLVRYATLNTFAYAITTMWFKWLNRRSQRKSFNWEEFQDVLKRHPLPKYRIVITYRWIYSTPFVRENSMKNPWA